MTLQELFRTSNFDQAFAYISKFHPKSANSRFPYTVAYEYLCQLKAKPGIEICFTKRPLDEDDCAPDVNVWCSVLEGIDWNEAMGAEVVVSDEITNAPQAILHTYADVVGISEDEAIAARLSEHIHECAVVLRGRHLDMAHPCFLRPHFLHHYHWHPLRKDALPSGKAGPFAIR